MGICVILSPLTEMIKPFTPGVEEEGLADAQDRI